MKLRRLNIEGFRGAPKPFGVAFADKPHFIFSENGRGKSTIADALELLTLGDLLDFHREDCGIDATINLNGPGRALITADLLEPRAHLERTIEKDEEPSELNCDVPGLELQPIPILRQSTISQFMQRTSGQKRQALLELLDLDALNGFRATLRTAAGNAKERRKAAVSVHKEEVDALALLLGGKELVSRANELAKVAELKVSIATEDDVAQLSLTEVFGPTNRQPAVTALAQALESQIADPAKEWDAAVSDDEVRRGEALGVLLDQGREVLAGEWGEDSCPLCETEHDRTQLLERIRTRAGALAQSNERLEGLRSQLAQRHSWAAGLAVTIGELIGVAPPHDWPSQDKLLDAKGALESYAEGLGGASEKLTPVPVSPDLGIDFNALMPELQAAAAPEMAPEIAAMQSLTELRAQQRRVADRLQKADAARAGESAMGRLVEISDEKIGRAVEESLAGIEDLVGLYFEILMAEPLYTDVKLAYVARRSGQVEFEVRFGDHKVNPPQRIMSESQLNALGLALLLGRIKHSETPWRTLVLDDVVNSFDSPHRAGLVRLLRREFADWQLIILSHDSVFRDIALREADTEWEFHEIVSWTPADGPISGSGDPLNRLDQALKNGGDAAGLGGLSRRALELNLSRALKELHYKIPYDPASRYTARDYLDALSAGLKEKNSSLAEEEVLKRIGTGDYMATRTVHSRPGMPEATTDDLKQLVADLRDFDAVMRCGQCKKRPWFAKTPAGHQCECSQLKA